MKGINYHGLRFQAFLVIKLFVICISVAAYLVSQRSWIESHFHESYSGTPVTVQPVVELLDQMQPITDEYEQVPLEDRVFLYDDWIQSENPSSFTPQELLRVDFELFSRRAERTLVSGNMEQRRKALLFFRSSGDKRAIPLLNRVNRWAKRRKLDEFSLLIPPVINNIKEQ